MRGAILAATMLGLAGCSSPSQQAEMSPPKPPRPKAEHMADVGDWWSCELWRYVDAEHGNVVYVLVGDNGRSAMAAVPIGADGAP
jgi:hypothetical protein